jgi:hypothetical protein
MTSEQTWVRETLLACELEASPMFQVIASHRLSNVSGGTPANNTGGGQKGPPSSPATPHPAGDPQTRMSPQLAGTIAAVLVALPPLLAAM